MYFAELTVFLAQMKCTAMMVIVVIDVLGISGNIERAMRLGHVSKKEVDFPCRRMTTRTRSFRICVVISAYQKGLILTCACWTCLGQHETYRTRTDIIHRTEIGHGLTLPMVRSLTLPMVT